MAARCKCLPETNLETGPLRPVFLCFEQSQSESAKVLLLFDFLGLWNIFQLPLENK